jgi:hypothetical protein
VVPVRLKACTTFSNPAYLWDIHLAAYFV